MILHQFGIGEKGSYSIHHFFPLIFLLFSSSDSLFITSSNDKFQDLSSSLTYEVFWTYAQFGINQDQNDI